MKLPWRKAASKQSLDEPLPGAELVVKIGALGWSAWTYKLDEGLGQRWSGEAGDIDDRGPERYAKVLRLALQTLPAPVLKEPGPITLLLDSPDVVFVDNRAQPLAAGGVSSQTIRRHGIQTLGVRDVSYGRTPLNGAGERQVYGFIDSAVLGEYLAAMDRQFARLEAVRGCGEALIQRGMSGDDEVYAGLLIGGDHSRLVVLNRRLGALLLRTVPIGVLTLAEEVAALSGISRKEALAGLAERDYLSGTLQEPAGDTEGVHLGPIERALAPVLGRLERSLRESIDFFADQQACGRPQRLELLGELDRLQGMGRWLGTVLGRDDNDGAALRVSVGTCGDWPAGSVGVGINLLSGVEGSGLSIGKLHYAYVNRRLVVDSRRTAAKRGNARTVREGDPGVTAGGGNTRRPLRSQRTGVGSGAGGGWFKRLLSSDSSAPSDELEPGTTRQYLMLFYLLLFAALFGAWDAYENLAKRHEAEAVAYVAALNAQIDLRAQLRRMGVTQAPVRVDKDKVLWTEKFLSLANNINSHLWLTEVYLSEEERQLDKIKVVSKKLVIEGAALPSTRGHIAEIADYMSRLEADKDGFMDDFREIAFEGSRLDDDEDDRVVRFTLAAWYDENKRLEEKPTHKKPEQGAPGLDQTLENVENHNRALERARRGDL